MKVFISSDIEGTCGIVSWGETEASHADSAYFRRQMSREVAAACEGAIEAGADEIVVKDAHDSARNIDPLLLPRGVRLLRGWTRDPLCMMSGLDRTYDAVFYTGYHSRAGSGGNPLSHTLSTRLHRVCINGVPVSEFNINSMTAAYLGVKSVLLTGDAALCKSALETVPGLQTVAVSEGTGAGSVSLNPDTACERIRHSAKQALTEGMGGRPALAESFFTEITYKTHHDAYSASYYPGAKQLAADTVGFEADDYYEVLRFLHFTA